MKPQLRIVTGNPAGTVLVYSHHNITIGRHPDSDVAFDAHQDLEVSVRHAAISSAVTWPDNPSEHTTTVSPLRIS